MTGYGQFELHNSARSGILSPETIDLREYRFLEKCRKFLKIWRARRDSNSRPPGSKPGTLSTELRAQGLCVDGPSVGKNRAAHKPLSDQFCELAGMIAEPGLARSAAGRGTFGSVVSFRG